MDKKITIITILVVLFVFLAVGGWFWYLKQAQRTSNQNQRDRNSLQGENETAEHQNSKEKTVANINLDTTTWKEYQSQDLGIVFKIPQGWKPNNYLLIFPKGENGVWISIGEHSWPKYFKNKIDREFSVSQAIEDEHLVYDDGYNFMLQKNSFKEISLPLGDGVEYPKMVDLFYFYAKNSLVKNNQNRRLFIIFSKKTKKTYSFQYGYDDDTYDPIIDKAFGEIVKSVHILQ
jgi:hypothetical protein